MGNDADSASIDLTVVEPPSGRHLHFWALQASFFDGNRPLGAGHLGLQWIDGYPGSTAVNWGGYHSTGGVLGGTESALPGALGNPHTRNFSWRPGVPYRLTIDRGRAGWRGSVTDLGSGEETIVRELLAGGDRLGAVVMWSEVFAPCEGPTTAVAWSNAVATISGDTVRAHSFELNYQRFEDGGCTNTNTQIEPVGGAPTLVQRTAVQRTNHTGSTLRVT